MGSLHTYQDNFLNQLAVERKGLFRQNSPWTSNFSPVLSAMVFIALSTLVVFYMQARSLTRKMRPTVSGVPTRLPATIVWGLFSLQHSHLSHVQARSVQPQALVHLDFGNSPLFEGVGVPSNMIQSLPDIPDDLISTKANKHQFSSASYILSQAGLFQTHQQTRVSNEVKRKGKQAVDLKDAQERSTTDSSGLCFFTGQRLLKLCDAKNSKGTPYFQFADHIQLEMRMQAGIWSLT